MGYCGPRGIPLSQFLSWDQADQDAALAWAGHEARRCSSCGYHPDVDDQVHTHVDVCPGCEKHAAASKAAGVVPGAHVHLARGGQGTCPRCITAVKDRKASGPR